MRSTENTHYSLRYNRFQCETPLSRQGTSLTVIGKCGFTTSASGAGAAGREKETSLINNYKRATGGEGGSSSLQSSDAAGRDGADAVAAETQSPIVDTSWDPYQVWLTRVKQPREQSARTRRPVRSVADQPAAPDLSETARLRALTIVR